MIKWIRRLFEPRYSYGYVERKGCELPNYRTEPARIDKKTGRVQFILLNGEWHDMGEGWQQFFNPYKELP